MTVVFMDHPLAGAFASAAISAPASTKHETTRTNRTRRAFIFGTPFVFVENLERWPPPAYGGFAVPEPEKCRSADRRYTEAGAFPEVFLDLGPDLGDAPEARDRFLEDPGFREQAYDRAALLGDVVEVPGVEQHVPLLEGFEREIPRGGRCLEDRVPAALPFQDPEALAGIPERAQPGEIRSEPLPDGGLKRMPRLEEL